MVRIVSTAFVDDGLSVSELADGIYYSDKPKEKKKRRKPRKRKIKLVEKQEEDTYQAAPVVFKKVLRRK